MFLPFPPSCLHGAGQQGSLPHQCLPAILFILSLSMSPAVHAHHAAGGDMALTRVYRFDRLTVSDGLSQGFVSSILQDKHGFMWFGTRDGLNRYDGYSFKVYRHNVFDSTTISDNRITATFEDRHGRLWVGTQKGHLHLFDRETESFLHIHAAELSNNPVSINGITEDTRSESQSLWVTSGGGILHRLLFSELSDPLVPQGAGRAADNGHFHYSVFQYSLAPEDSLRELFHSAKTPLYQGSSSPPVIDRNRNLWVDLHGTVLIGMTLSSDGSPLENSFRRLPVDKELPKGRRFRAEGRILETTDKTIWWGNTRGLARVREYPLRPETKRWEIEYTVHSDVVDSSSETPGINNLREDDQGSLWLTIDNNLIFVNPSDGTHRNYPRDIHGRSSVNNTISSLFVDSAGLIWIGSVGYGVARLDPRTEYFNHYSDFDHPGQLSMGQMVLESSGNIWIRRKSSGWWYFDRERLERAAPGGHDYSEVETLVEDKQGSIWYASKPRTASGHTLSRMDPSDRSARTFYPRSGDTSEIFISRIYEDHQGIIWGAGEAINRSPGNHAILAIDPKTDEVVVFSEFINGGAKHPPVLRPITGISVEETDGKPSLNRMVWLSCRSGLHRFDLQSGTVRHYAPDPENQSGLNSSDITSIHADPIVPDRYLWIGTNGGGLNRMDVRTEHVVHFTSEDGLPNNVIYGILTDEQQNLWVSTNRGLSKVSLGAGVNDQGETISEVAGFRNFDAANGLQGDEFNAGAYSKSRSGELAFGGLKGFNVFHPADIRANPHRPNVMLTGLRINHEYVDFGMSESILKRPISETGELVLPYSANTISLDVAAMDYAESKKNQFSYKLDNFDTEWSFPTTNPSVTYTRLPHGEYMLRVRGSNSDGIWNEEGATLRIVITPPWWQTTWAYFLYVMLVVGTLAGVVYFRERAVRKRHKDLELAVKERTLTISQQAEELRELNTMKSRFFASISHEFRTPLTLILDHVENALASPDCQSRERLTATHRNAKQLLHLINQLLDLSKFGARQMKLQARVQNIVPLLRHITGSFESLAGSKNITLRFETSEDPVPVNFEEEKIEKVMQNLLSNAIKFTAEEGSILVNVNTQAVAGKGGESPDAVGRTEGRTEEAGIVEIIVRDSGIGMSEEVIEHIFDPFFQAECSATREYDGTGIGLALTKELVQIHGGRISVESAPAFGSTFIVNLPLGRQDPGLEQVNDAPLPSPAEMQGGSAGPLSRDKPSRSEMAERNDRVDKERQIVLVVEDNADMRAYITQTLSGCHSVICAPNGEEGYDLAVREIPDLIITDVMMPGMDGYELTRRVRSESATSHIPIIMLTARAEERDRFEGLETGADAFLVKPFGTKELQIRVRKLIELRQQLLRRIHQGSIISASNLIGSSLEQKFLEALRFDVEKHLSDENYRVEELCQAAGVSRRQLERKLKALLGCSPALYVRRIRMEHARQLLMNRAGNVTEVAFEVGYNNASAFTRAFREIFSESPSDILRNED